MAEKKQYQVLARKYRSQTFDDLVGQDVLVQTLTTAIENDRLAHAYILTGVRGVGKTSTARIFTKALNCTGADGKNDKPTIKPCGVCENCKSIVDDRHVDVIEMDAASNTGVDDIREVIEGAQYKPSMARFKVYIIDEVHMLSKNAFNALLKTLEEPPEYVKFIFATTEIRKVPITILSRCQRFDLPRIEIDVLKKHFENICKLEEVKAEDEALSMIARSAEGSARDGLSILDQAIAHGNGDIKATEISDMLGLADRSKVFDLFENLMSGEIASALDILSNLYKMGADPLSIINDLVEMTHFIMKTKIVPASLELLPLTKEEQDRVKENADKLTVSILNRVWQMLIKGLDELTKTNKVLQTAEMLLIRIAHSSNMPSPDDLIKKLNDGSLSLTDAKGSDQKKNLSSTNDSVNKILQAKAVNENASTVNLNINENDYSTISTIEGVVKLLHDKKEPIMALNVEEFIKFISLDNCLLEITVAKGAPKGLQKDLEKILCEKSSSTWKVIYSDNEGGLTLKEQRKQALEKYISESGKDSVLREVLRNFPDAKIDKVI